MKIYISIILLLFIFCAFAYSQNLVLNPSFEDSIGCPNGPTQIDLSVGWSAYGGTPDYFNSCASSCLFPGTCYGIPQNVAGSQSAYDGVAYAGILTYAYGGGGAREYIGTTLTIPLSIHKKYFVSAYVCRSDGYISHGGTNNLGFRFSTTPYVAFTNPVPTDNFSHVNDTILISDSSSWTKIYGSFIADSAYQFLAIGNFYDDQHTDTVDIYPGPFSSINSAYYLVDYVCVSEDSLWQATTGIVSNSKEERQINLYPNPFNIRLTVSVDDDALSEIIMYDILSRKIFQQKFLYSISFDTELFESGIYIYEIVDFDGSIVRGEIMKQ